MHSKDFSCSGRLGSPMSLVCPWRRHLVGLPFGFCMVWLMLSLLSSQPAFGADYNPLPDTGQTKCYGTRSSQGEIPCPSPGQPLYGQDAQYHGLQQSFTKYVDYKNSGHNVTIDNNTGLMWMTGTVDYNNDGNIDDDDKFNWQDAKNYCENLTYASYDDWRLPTLFELATIVDYSTTNPTINSHYFSAVGDEYLSSTIYSYIDSYVWFLDFSDGMDESDSKSDRSYYVRCVRGDVGFEHHFLKNGDIVMDQGTGLMWENDANVSDRGKVRTWTEALDYCENLTLGGYTDWRLPNINELRSIVDYSRTFPAIHPIFSIYFEEDINNSVYWSSTSYSELPGHAYIIVFDVGNVYFGAKSGQQFVRCVRSGLPSGSPTDSNVTDDDSDGLETSQEDMVPNASGTGRGDGNGDGTDDSQQNYVASLPTVDGSHYATLENSDASNLDTHYGLSSVSAVRPPSDAPSNIQFPYGMFEFTVTGVSNGGTVTMRLFVPKDTRIAGYWKKNQNTGKWDNIASNIVHGPSYAPNKTVITFQLTDGGPYDEDGIANGSIQDQGGPGYENSGGGGGEPVNVPTMNLGGILFFSLLTAFIGIYTLRRCTY